MAGIDTRKLVVTIGGTDYTAQVSSVAVVSAASDSDFITYADAAAGGARLYTLKGTAVQDAVVGTLWDKIWSAAGTTVAVLVKPYGNATATAAQPHYSGNVTVKEPDGNLIGGDANASTTARQTVDFEWPFDAKPTKVIT